MAFIDDDEVKKFDGDVRVVDDGQRLFRQHHLRRADFFGCLVEFLIFQKRIHSLNSADANLAVFCDEGSFQALNVIQKNSSVKSGRRSTTAFSTRLTLPALNAFLAASSI